MKLVWKLLRQHISIPQFAGFFFANLVGMLIILLGVQFYNDIQTVYDSEDNLINEISFTETTLPSVWAWSPLPTTM